LSLIAVGTRLGAQEGTLTEGETPGGGGSLHGGGEPAVATFPAAVGEMATLMPTATFEPMSTPVGEPSGFGSGEDYPSIRQAGGERIINPNDVGALNAAIADVNAGIVSIIRLNHGLAHNAPESQRTYALTVTLHITNPNANLTIFGNNAVLRPNSVLGFRLIKVNYNATVRIFDTNFFNGYQLVNGLANYGGAIHNAGKLSIYDSVFYSNYAENGGGAIASTGSGSGSSSTVLNIYRSRFEGNFAGLGGAIQNDYSSKLYVECSSFTGNDAQFADNIANGNQSNTYSALKIIYSTFGPLLNGGYDMLNIASGVIIDATQNWWYNAGSPPTSRPPSFVNVNVNINTVPVLTSDPLAPTSIIPQCSQGTNMNVFQVESTALTNPNDGSCGLVEATYTANSLASYDAIGNFDCLPTMFDVSMTGYVINVPTGTITLTAPFNNTVNGLPTITTSILMRGTGTEPSVVQRNSTAAAFRLIEIAAGGALTLDNMTVMGGSIVGDGGGIYNAGTLTLRNNSGVERNRATGNGGGIYNIGALDVQNSRIQLNSVTQTSNLGGGVFNSSSGQITNLSHSCVVFNTAWGDGGGIYSQSAVNLGTGKNWWGNPSGPTVPDTNNNSFRYEGIAGDSIFNVTYSQFAVSHTELPISNNCLYQGEALFNPLDRGEAGRPELALEMYVRVNQVLGREISLEEVFAFIAYRGGGTQGLNDQITGYLVQGVGRYFFEFRNPAPNRNPTCPIGINNEYDRYVELNFSTVESLGFLCFLGNYSEWFGENIRVENWVYEVTTFIASTLDSDSTPNDLTSNITWRQRAALVVQQVNNPALVYNNEAGACDANMTSGHGNAEHRNCPWLWGNYSTLSANSTSRLTDATNRIRVEIDSTDNQPLRASRYSQAPSGPEKNIIWMFIAIISPSGFPTPSNTSAIGLPGVVFRTINGSDFTWTNEYFFFTYNQDRAFKCDNPLRQEGNFPVC
jgi:predicted outer membrane repeat protein